MKSIQETVLYTMLNGGKDLLMVESLLRKMFTLPLRMDSGTMKKSFFNMQKKEPDS